MTFGWAAFWIALAAVIISGRWLKARREAMKYDTVVRLAEKTGRIDEEQFKMLFPPPGPLPPHWFAPPPAGQGRMVLRVFGTILMFTGVGVVVSIFLLQGYFTPSMRQAAVGGSTSRAATGRCPAPKRGRARRPPPRRR